MSRRSIALFLVLTLALPTVAAPRRRAVAKPAFDTSTVRGWLEKNAHPLASTELTPWSYDLEPLRSMIGGATLAGLGDGSHGTHEFYTTKLRMIDYLVREMDFDVIAFEAPFPLFERINQYAQGGPGDPRALLNDANDRLTYRFWDVEEMLAVVEWVREYNLTRGTRPPVEIAGFDILDQVGAIAAVVSYLGQVDPAAAARAESDYACVLRTFRDEFCEATTAAVHQRMTTQRETYSTAGSVRAYDDALQYATVVTQSFGFFDRDAKMATNARWIQAHRGRTGKTILWAHQEHIGETEIDFLGGPSMGSFLAATYGANYFTIGSLSGTGSFRSWQRSVPTTGAWPATVQGSYESYLRMRGLPAMIVPLEGELPAWLRNAAPFQSAGTGGLLPERNESLSAKLDAVIYIETTTPTTPLP